MGKKKDFSKYSIKEILATISEKKNSNFGKYVAKCAFDKKAPTIDIRNLGITDDGNYIIGKGISLTPDETEKLSNVLIDLGYGDTIKMEDSIKKRKKMYGFDDEILELDI